jgi:hypothetical protein
MRLDNVIIWISIRKGSYVPKNPVLKEIAQAVDNTQTTNLEDWSITFKEF